MSDIIKNFAETLEPHLTEKSTKKNQNFDTLNLQSIQSFSTPHYTEKTGGLPCCQTLAPSLLGRHSADQQVSTKHNVGFPQPTLG
jgi:hypothetical protein